MMDTILLKLVSWLLRLVSYSWRGRKETLSYIDGAIRASRERCVQKWIALGIERSVADALADDRHVGSLPESYLPMPEQPARILVGEIGSGKSLAAERVFQRLLNEARNNWRVRVPVLLSSRSLDEGLRSAIERECKRASVVPGRHSIFLIVDGADEVGSQGAAELIQDVGVFTHECEDCRALVTCRPFSFLDDRDDVVRVQPLDKGEAQALITRIRPKFPLASIENNLPEQVREAIERPLFALLLALTEEPGRVRSAGELIAALVSRALETLGKSNDTTPKVLRRLAALSIQRGTRAIPMVDACEGESLSYLRESRLIEESDDKVSFSLPILNEWFAAQALIYGEYDLEALLADPQMLDAWRLPLAIAVASANTSAISGFCVQIAKRYPGFSTQMISSLTRPWRSEPNSLALSSHECGKHIRDSMKAIISGLECLAPLIAPVERDGTLRSLAVRVDDGRILSGWFEIGASRNDIVVLGTPLGLGGSSDSDLRCLKDGPPDGGPLWPWSWNLDHLQSELRVIMDAYAFPPKPGDELWHESMWNSAIAATKSGDLRGDPIPIPCIRQALSAGWNVQSSSRAHLSVFWRNSDEALRRLALCLYGQAVRWRDAHFDPEGRIWFPSQLHAHCQTLEDEGKSELECPWPVPDLQRGGMVWSPYSDGQLLARVRAVYEAAVAMYLELVEEWFPHFSLHLGTAALLPAILKGQLYRAEGGAPVLRWYWQPLPMSGCTSVDIQFVAASPVARRDDLDQLWNTMLKLRPASASWLRAVVRSEVLRCFDSTSAMRLAYTWLGDDLKHIGWL